MKFGHANTEKLHILLTESSQKKLNQMLNSEDTPTHLFLFFKCTYQTCSCNYEAWRMVLKLLPAVTLASRALRGMSPVDQMRTNNNKQLISLAAEGNTCCSDMSHIRGEQHSLVSVPLSCYITFNNCKSNDVGVPQRQMYSYLNIHHFVIFRGHLANRSVNHFFF